MGEPNDLVARGDRVELRRLTVADAPWIYRLQQDELWLRYIGDRGVHAPEDAVPYLEHGPLASYAARGFGLYAIVRRPDGEPLGICGLVARDGLSLPDLGFAVLAEHRGVGYATEAGALALRHAERDLKLTALAAIMSPDNNPSRRVLTALGFADVGLRRLPNATQDVQYFEWHAVATPR